MKKLFGLLFIFILSLSSVQTKDLRFVQITDVRFDDQKTEIFSKTIKDINKLKDVSFVIFTGDNINRPDKKYLEIFIREAKRLKCPFYIVIGDKDVNKHKDLSKKQYTKYSKKKLPKEHYGYTNYLFKKDDVVFIVVDGAKDVIPSSNGYYKEDVLEWLNSKLELYSKNNVVILQHFPIVPPENRENYVTFKPEKYLEIIQNHPNVKAVISGHFGENKVKTVNGVSHISTAPMPDYRIIDILDCTSENPTIWAEVKEVE